jgi:hypothetical protein
MIERVGTDLFRAHFLKAPRPNASLWDRFWAWLSGRGAALDGWAIGQAVKSTIGHCDTRSVSGAFQIWNEYRVFMAPQDLERLRPMEALLRRDLVEMLHRAITDLGAETIGDVEIRLVPDEGGQTSPGVGMVRVAFRAPDARPPEAAGDVTIRFKTKDPPGASSPTLRVGYARVRGPGGSVELPDGVRIVLGRAHEGASADHRALPGAGSKVSRRHVALLSTGGELEVTREPSSNPVRVDGRALSDGQTVRARLPVPLVLADDVHVMVEPC